ncbi:hypothetical protein [Actinacidiphila sp. ITFR-21]|uniref:hypothetical protein n=1 Tax=Actinacidiphila sp. ITFR-21 TaxID=3075199 RepID=UPI00288A4B44|nr:hypothetical protein [Streptomyces sp. ITFR-21]WNI20337.1 hypothetical protein RLT57_32555 [Streptomyces sp. ITFR-21]
MTNTQLNTAAEVRAFLALCLDPGPGRDKRTVARVTEIMPDWLAGPLNQYAPHLAGLSDAVHQAEAAAAAARAAHAEALEAWIAGDDTPPTGAAGAPTPQAATRHSPAPLQPRYLESFAENASTEAIHGHLVARRADRRGLDRHISFLEALLAHRSGQIAAGTWPAANHQHNEGVNR